jgi:PUA domain protein
MSPGIVEADPSITEGDLVIIIEQAHGKAIAIGRALITGKNMKGGKGKAIKSIHYVGDEIWKLEQK